MKDIRFRWVPSRKTTVCCTLIAAFSLSGCISTLEYSPDGPFQSIEIVALGSSGASLSKLKCVVSNDKGKWPVDVPGTVRVRRSPDPLHIECEEPSGARLSNSNEIAIDSRDARAEEAAKRYGIVGTGVGVGLLGTVAMGPAGLLYAAAGGVGMGGYMAWEKKFSDTATGMGYSYPSRIELRFDVQKPIN